MQAKSTSGLTNETAATLGLLTILVALLPFFTDSNLAVALMRHLMAAALIVAIWLSAEGRTIAILVTAIALAGSAAHLLTFRNAAWVLITQLLEMAFLLTTASYLMHRLWTAREIATAALIVATAVYFLLGLFWASVFSMTEMYAPGSFANACPPDSTSGSCEPGLAQFPRLTYFSFVTLTTLGYGDVVPLTSSAEGVATMAAISGQLFMAVLVGRLVGSYLSTPRPDRSG